ncbi:MAG TPA: hypothetical protein VM889_01265 [Candidatus Thermoplasmatota archaeon]|nr:hypothetical protein [Candidatus Thermoplasmatota archaeon]
MDGPRLSRAALVALLALAPAFAGCLGGGGERPVVAASAPREASGMTVFFAAPHRLIGLAPPQAELQVLYNGKPAYPAGGMWATFPVSDRQGAFYLPYSFFVVGNGQYEVRLRYDGEIATTRVSVDKWVEYVYLHPYPTDRRTIAVDLQLSRQSGGDPSNRIMAYGDLTIHVYYRGEDTSGSTREYVHRVALKTSGEKDFTRLEIPRSVFNRGPGYYSFESKFDNLDAKGNHGVGNDPSLAARSPPWNWIRIE